MEWNEIMEIENPHKALKAIAHKVDTENLSIEETEERISEYTQRYDIDLDEMAFYPNRGRVLDPNDILTIEYEAFRRELVGLVNSIDAEVGLEEENAVLILYLLNSEEKIVKFNEWIRSRLVNGQLVATEAEICRAAVQVSKGIEPSV